MLESLGDSNIIIWMLLDIVVTSVCLWLAAKITAVETGFIELFPAVVVSGLVFPFAGGIASAIVLFAILHKALEVSVWPDLILMVIVSKGILILGSAMLL